MSRSSAAASVADCRPARNEAVEIGRHGLDRRLLQHHLGEPDAIRIGARPAAPRRGPTRQGSVRACRSYQARSAAAEGVGLPLAWRGRLALRAWRASLACGHPGHCGRRAGSWQGPKELRQQWRIRRGRPRRTVAELIGKTLDPLLRKRGLARAELIAWWPDIVGAAYAGRTAPERIRWPRDGKAATLVVRCDPALVAAIRPRDGPRARAAERLFRLSGGRRGEDRAAPDRRRRRPRRRRRRLRARDVPAALQEKLERVDGPLGESLRALASKPSRTIVTTCAFRRRPPCPI